MKRYHITLGADTTAGGKVIAASSACTIEGIAIAVEGDKVSCPACKSTGTIRPFGTRIPESWNGKQLALQDDLCMCKCPSPPKLVATQTLRYQQPGGDIAATATTATTAAAATATATAAPAATPEQAASHTRQAEQDAALAQADEPITLRLLDDYTGQALPDKPYRLEFATKVIEGRTDGDGHTLPFPAADRAALVAWHILDEAGDHVQ